MGTATKTQWEGRLGIELVGKMQGCCVKAILKWRPQMIGQKNSCTYCGSMMKTIRAGEVISPTFVGWLGEEKAAASNVEPEMVIGGLFFSKDKFASEEAAKTWMADRDIESEEVVELDDHAFYVPLERLLQESVRAIWVAPGVVGEIGVTEKQVAVGGGQASMSSPGITTTSMASGGMVDPSQVPTAAVAGATPNLMHGLTETQDGHQHEFYLSPAEEAAGLRVKGLTSYNNGHAHMIEAAVSSDGAFDSRTAPDQSVVGGHAHSHRVVFPGGGASPMATKEKEEDPEPSPVVTKECRVTSMDISLLRKAADAIEGFYKNVLGEREVTKISDFKAQMSQAIERAKGGVGAVEGRVTIEVEDLAWLKNCSAYLSDLGGRIAKGLVEKGGTSEGAKLGWETRRGGGGGEVSEVPGRFAEAALAERIHAGVSPEERRRAGKAYAALSGKGSKQERARAAYEALSERPKREEVKPDEGENVVYSDVFQEVDDATDAANRYISDMKKKGYDEVGEKMEGDYGSWYRIFNNEDNTKETIVEVKAEGRDKDVKFTVTENKLDSGEKEKSLPFVGRSTAKVDKSVPSKAQVDAAGEAAGKGNVEALIDWAGDVGFDGCVKAIKGSKDAMSKIDDPEKVCGWLKARAREKGVLAPEHGGKKE
jgi:regulator of RNase E activity RraB